MENCLKFGSDGARPSKKNGSSGCIDQLVNGSKSAKLFVLSQWAMAEPVGEDLKSGTGFLTKTGLFFL